MQAKTSPETRRGNPVRIIAPHSSEAVARLEFARAQDSLYNLAGHAPGLPGFNPLMQASYAPQWSMPWPNPTYGLPAGLDLKAVRGPPCDIADQGTEFVVQVEMPGVPADQVQVLCHDRTLLVQATPGSEIDAAALVQRERVTSAPVQRTIPLPAEIQPSACKARLRDGILTVTLPKLVPTEAPRRIEVQT